MFSLNSIGCVTKWSCWHFMGNMNGQMYVYTCSNLHTERFEVIFNHDKSKRMSDKMNKE